MNPSRTTLFDLPVDCLSTEETLDRIERIVQSGQPSQHTVVNAAKIVSAARDTLLKESIVESDLINIDGQPVVWAARFLGIKVPEKVSGSDLMPELLKKSEEKGWKVFFLGATLEVLAQMIERLRRDHPRLRVAGFQDGYFKDSEAETVARTVRDARPDILFVGMPTPRKENFIRQYKDFMRVPFSMGVGGTFDILAGKTRRAPRWMQMAGLEWFFRLCQEPHRLFKRYFRTNALFFYMVLKARFHLRKGKSY